MAGHKYLPNSESNLFDELWRRNIVLEERLRDLERAFRNQDTPRPLPRILPLAYGDGYEGQRAIDTSDEQLTWFSDGEWRKAAASGVAIYAIEVFENFVPIVAGDGAFEWEIPEDLDGSVLVKVEAYVTTASSSGNVQVQVRNETTGNDMLSTKVTIDAGDLNSKDSATPAVVNETYAGVSWGHHLNIDVDAIGSGATGLGMILYFAPAAVAGVTIQGAKGDPGGITTWMGQWSNTTTYTTGQAVSNGGSSYVAIQGSTDVEPGVDSGWQTYWMILASSQQNSVAAVVLSQGGYTLYTGSQADFDVPFAATITGVRLLADRVGSAVVDIKKTTYGSFPTATSIVGSTPPTLTNQQKYEDTALSGWTTALSAGDILEIWLTSVSVIRRLTVSFILRRI